MRPRPNTRDEVIAALLKNHGNVTQAAVALDTSRRQLQQLLNRYRIDRKHLGVSTKPKHRSRDLSHESRSSLAAKHANPAPTHEKLAVTLAVTGGYGATRSPRATSSGRSSLPENLRYAGARAVGDMGWDVDGVGTALNVLGTTDPAPAVIAHYEKLLAGWKDNPVKAQAGTSIGRTSPDGKQTVVVTATRGPTGGSTFSIYRIFGE